mmetsp:Transcript_114137/g.327915  ORF Transcript_114137/g.327915 Transcript_114137/m.327915 type:complete len:329 (+) Transcript_114137:71-1057(+)
MPPLRLWLPPPLLLSLLLNSLATPVCSGRASRIRELRCTPGASAPLAPALGAQPPALESKASPVWALPAVHSESPPASQAAELQAATIQQAAVQPEATAAGEAARAAAGAAPAADTQDANMSAAAAPALLDSRQASLVYSRLRRGGPWLPLHTDGAGGGVPKWVRGIDSYLPNFVRQNVYRERAPPQRVHREPAFGGIRNGAVHEDFALPCQNLRFYNGSVVGDVGLVCRARGCKEVVDPFFNAAAAVLGRPLDITLLESLKCVFKWAHRTFQDRHVLIWDIVLASECNPERQNCPLVFRVPLVGLTGWLAPEEVGVASPYRADGVLA